MARVLKFVVNEQSTQQDPDLAYALRPVYHPKSMNCLCLVPRSPREYFLDWGVLYEANFYVHGVIKKVIATNSL